MRIAKHDIPTAIDVPGAKARALPDFGETDGCGTLAAEYFSLGAGTDIAPLLQGLEDDACQAPHWGYMISGEVVVSYTGGRPDDTCSGGDVFHWPAGHSVRGFAAHVTVGAVLSSFTTSVRSASTLPALSFAR